MKLELNGTDVRMLLGALEFRARLEEDADTGTSNYYARELWSLYHRIKAQVPARPVLVTGPRPTAEPQDPVA